VKVLKINNAEFTRFLRCGQFGAKPGELFPTFFVTRFSGDRLVGFPASSDRLI
jgi:hypothetical protein